MKMVANSYVVARIEAIQQELDQLKKTIAHQTGGRKGKARLKGLWKGVKISEKDIESAKKSLLKSAYKFDE